MQKLNKECELLREDKQKADFLLTQCKEKVKSISKDLEVARERCDELVTESNKKEEEKKHMMESLAVVKKEAAESAKKAALSLPSSSNSGVKSEFTMEQMTTQVKYLSDRINCPVCNTREKKCILLRCRHMFCRQCVDENIKVRQNSYLEQSFLDSLMQQNFTSNFVCIVSQEPKPKMPCLRATFRHEGRWRDLVVDMK